jgi:sulfatase-modifying factor enzyme 1
MTVALDPLVPRPIDRPAEVPLDGAADLTILDTAKIFAAPAGASERAAWRRALERWQLDALRRSGYSDELYRDPGLVWTASCHAVCLAWLWDETLYDHDARRFTPESFIEGARREFGGFDAVVLWHAYPVIGLDERNQFDFYRDVVGLPELVAEFHRLGVRVFVDYNPWDVGTRREPVDDPTALAQVVAAIGADGVFLDTMREGGEDLRPVLRERCGSVALEGESSVPLVRIADHSLSWAQWFADSPVPGVLRAHWFARRHMLHHTRRWNRDHSEELQSAWINGCGMLVWENVFGSWVGWNDRDRSTLRSMLPVQRRFGRHLREGRWTPLAEGPAAPVFASRYDLDGSALWTLVNRADADEITVFPSSEGSRQRRFDLIAGVELPGPEVRVPARGVAGVLEIEPGAVDADLLEFLAGQMALDRAAGTTFPQRSAVRRYPARADAAAAPPGMEAVDAGSHDLRIRYQVRETGLYGEAPFIEEWKPLPPRLHALAECTVTVATGCFAVARCEVTNLEFATFLAATGYVPAEPNRFLASWIDGRPRPGHEEDPVTFVELADARAYAAWAHARLPTEHEWQLAAASGLLARAAPRVWNWTESEHNDGRTRFAILKGGSEFRAEGSDWYLPGGPQPPEFAVKLLLCGGGLARSSQIGFRCAVDLPAVPS